jgi:8-oxo-dGTP diphosphatase
MPLARSSATRSQLANWEHLQVPRDAVNPPRTGDTRRRRVTAYVTRERGGRRELLVFDHRDHPDAGTQVPAGRLDPGESLEQGLRRELHEEAGLDRIRIVAELAGPEEVDRHYAGSAYANHVFHVEPEEELPDEWEHVVFGDGDDAGLVFRYRWEPIRDDLMLWGQHDPLLKLLR